MTDNHEYSSSEYKYGFVSDIESETFPKGLDENIIRQIAKKRSEPDFILDFRLKAFAHWKKLKPPTWANIKHPEIDFQDISYYSAPKTKKKLDSLEDADPEILKTLDRLGISLEEKKRLLNVSMDIVIDSVSIGTTFHQELKDAGVILCSISEAVQKYPELIKQYLGTVVPYTDNFYAALNAAVFSDGYPVFQIPYSLFRRLCQDLLSW